MKVIKEESEGLGLPKINDDLFTYDTPLGTDFDEFNLLSGMDDDLFTYKVKIPGLFVFHVPCNRGYDEVVLTDEEIFDLEDENLIDENEIAEIFKIETDIFYFKTPLCKAFNELNYLLKVDTDLFTHDITGFKTYEEYKNELIHEWNRGITWVPKSHGNREQLGEDDTTYLRLELTQEQHERREDLYRRILRRSLTPAFRINSRNIWYGSEALITTKSTSRRIEEHMEEGIKRYGAFATRVASGTRSIRDLVCRRGGASSFLRVALRESCICHRSTMEFDFTQFECLAIKFYRYLRAVIDETHNFYTFILFMVARFLMLNLIKPKYAKKISGDGGIFHCLKISLPQKEGYKARLLAIISLKKDFDLNESVPSPKHDHQEENCYNGQRKQSTQNPMVIIP
ncbi:hypothetical protein Tco_1293982 [Tanacetum coccineum]